MDDRQRTPRKHVFAVNSSPDFLLIVREVLADEGYAVTTSDFEPNVFTRIVMRHPDALIIDLAAGESVGWDLLRRLFLEAKTTDIPVLVTSTSPELLEQALEEAALVRDEPLLLDEADGPRRAGQDDSRDGRRRLSAVRGPDLAWSRPGADWPSPPGGSPMRADDETHAERPLDPLDQLRHDLRSPLTTIRGRAYLLARAVRRAPSLTEDERTRMLAGVAAIETAVATMVGRHRRHRRRSPCSWQPHSHGSALNHCGRLLGVGTAHVADEDTGDSAHRADDVLCTRVPRVPGSVAVGAVHRGQQRGSCRLTSCAGKRPGHRLRRCQASVSAGGIPYAAARDLRPADGDEAGDDRGGLPHAMRSADHGTSRAFADGDAILPEGRHQGAPASAGG